MITTQIRKWLNFTINMSKYSVIFCFLLKNVQYL